MVPWLGEKLWFPDPRNASRSGFQDGLVALGGDFRPERLLLAYRSGIFPWSEDPISWWSPNPRGVLPFSKLHISRSLARTLRRQPYEITVDRAFRRVMEACAGPRASGGGTWISEGFIEAYSHLHELGRAHSVECWKDGGLVGGIYGVSFGSVFAGESMFHRADNASKVALVKLVEILQEKNFDLFDVQVVNHATLALGATSIPRETYLRLLAPAAARSDRW
ncbi:MAG: leucyl/phenylalanyl-tRNA--protein transferase [Verrucomicrobia bacterium]|nr:leucyl/phenylalanyl-tRNA--protein transferase [Verrucomicrobiota bacterium]